MIHKNIIQLYKIGKELGLSRKEITNTLFFKNRYPLILALMLIVILTIFVFFFWNVTLILYSKTTDPIYARGTKYSSISIKDFKDKK